MEGTAWTFPGWLNYVSVCDLWRNEFVSGEEVWTESKGACLCRAALFADEMLKQEQEQARLNEARKISVVNVNPTNIRPHSDTPEIRKYKKRFNSEILCAALWGETVTEASSQGQRQPLVAAQAWSVCACLCRGESAGGDGERPHAAGSERSRQSLQSDQSAALPTNGRPGGTQRPGHHLRWVRLLKPAFQHGGPQ